MFLDKKFLAIKKRILSKAILSLELHQLDEELHFVVLRTSFSFQVLSMWHLHDTNSLDLISGLRGILWQPFYPLLKKEPKNLSFPSDENIEQPMQYTALSDVL